MTPQDDSVKISIPPAAQTDAEIVGLAEHWRNWFNAIIKTQNTALLWPQQSGPELHEHSFSAYHFFLDNSGLSLLSGPRGHSASPLRVDFANPQMRYRQKTLGKKQPLARALAARPGLKVLDVTFGLGKDAFFIASLGCQVMGLEASPIIYALAADGVRRLAAGLRGEGQEVLTLSVQFSDSRIFLDALTEATIPDVIYMDPMYPTSGKAALPKKELQWLRELVEPNPERDRELLASALRRARQRVVVKRPLNAAPLAGGVWRSYKGSTTRYDVYQTRLV